LAATALLAGCATSREFPNQNQGGNYEFPDVVVPASEFEAPPLARELACPGRLVVYAADLELVPNCTTAGPVTARVIGNAAARAARYAMRSVTCKKPCEKQVSLLWIGWKRGGNAVADYRRGGQVIVKCMPPGKPRPADVVP
jgi:hypothetical protein